MKRAQPGRPARGRGNPARGRATATALLLCLALGACAVVEAPPGGPQDMTAPRLASVSPDSGAVALGEVRSVRLVFTEKMTRQPAEGWLHFYPAQRIARTRWHGTLEAEVELFEPLPTDTVVVVEITNALQDAHKVKARESRRFPLATGAAIPGGRLTGALVLGDSAVTNGVVELFALPPDSLEYFQQPLLRRAITDRTGRWTFEWLPVPGGPWLVRAFSDADANLRPGDREAQRLLPDTLSLTVERPEVQAGALTIYAHGTPGRLRVPPFDPRGWAGRWYAWTMAVSENDTGWTPGPAVARGPKPGLLDPAAGATLEKIPSGAVRVVVFADVDGDSLFGGVPTALLRPAAAAASWPDSLPAPAYLEPWWLIEDLVVPPGLSAQLIVPLTPPGLTAWTLADSLTGPVAPADSTSTRKEAR